MARFQSRVLSDVLVAMMRVESTPQFVDLFANLETDVPNNIIAVFANNVQTSAPINSHFTAAFIIFAAAFEMSSILPMLM